MLFNFEVPAKLYIAAHFLMGIWRAVTHEKISHHPRMKWFLRKYLRIFGDKSSGREVLLAAGVTAWRRNALGSSQAGVCFHCWKSERLVLTEREYQLGPRLIC